MRLSPILIVLLMAPTTLAHDLWLVATPDRLERPAAVTESLAVGHPLDPEEVYPLDDLRRVLRFTAWSSAGERDLDDELRWTDETSIELRERGTHLLGLEMEPSITTLTRATFRSYLEEETRTVLLDHPAADENGIRERFSRHMKQLIQVGDDDGQAWSRTLGHRLEIVPRTNPLGLATGGTLEVRVLFEGAPIADLPISIHASDGATVHAFSTMTDGEGSASLEIPPGHTFLIRAVHIRPAEDEGVEFESFWTTLSYAID